MTDRKINILFLIDTYTNGGGTETHLADLVKHLDRSRFRCRIAAFDLEECPFVQRIRKDGTTVRHIPVGPIYGFQAVRRSFDLMRFIKDNGIDIVQTFHFKSDTYGALVSKLAGVRRIISSRRDLGHLKSSRHIWLNRLINPLVDRFIMVCDSVGEAAVRTEGIPRNRTTTIYNGVDLKRLEINGSETADLRRKLDIPEDAFVIGSVAYFRPEKAYHVFFEAIEKLQSSVKNWVALILGDGPLEDGFKALCRKKGLERQVRFMGSVLDVPNYLSLMDVLCLVPDKNEGFSNAILEGMAMGKPIVATRVGGNPEAVEDGRTGFLIPPGDPDSLVRALLALCEDSDLRKRMGEAGRKRIEEKFVLKDMIRKMERLYLEIHREGRA